MKRLLSLLFFALVGIFSTNAREIDNVAVSAKNNAQVVDVSGKYAIVGMTFYKNMIAGNKAGGAYIFCNDTSGLKMQAKLVAPDATDSDFYGSAVAIYGDYCVVGSSQKNIGTHQNQGKIYIYKRNGTSWNLESTQVETAGNAGDQFGYSVDISQNSNGLIVIAVGVPGANNGKGQVYTYARNNIQSKWYNAQTISPKDLTNNNRFGLSVSMDKDCLAVNKTHYMIVVILY